MPTPTPTPTPQPAQTHAPQAWLGRTLRSIGSQLGISSVPRAELRRRYSQAASRFIALMGADVHYTDAGCGEVLVMVHGFASSLQTWDALATDLRRSYRVICLDLPPFGVTGPLFDEQGRTLTIDTPVYRRFFDAFMDALGIERATLLGNSLGGMIAWDYAARHPRRIDKLVLIDAAGFPMKLPLYIALFKRRLVRWSSPWLLPEPVIRSAVRSVYGDSSKIDEPTFRRYIDFFHGHGTREAIGKMVPTFDFDAIERGGLLRLQQSTLILWGEEDSWIPLRHAQEFGRAIPHARLITYPGLGHVPMEENPVRVAADIREFLETEARPDEE
jgi:pimeloyl-ACP methyl ester carboxylesterase